MNVEDSALEQRILGNKDKNLAAVICLFILLLFGLQRNRGLRIFFLMQKFWKWERAPFGTQHPSMDRTLLSCFCFAQ